MGVVASISSPREFSCLPYEGLSLNWSLGWFSLKVARKYDFWWGGRGWGGGCLSLKGEGGGKHFCWWGGGVYKPPFLADLMCEQPLNHNAWLIILVTVTVGDGDMKQVTGDRWYVIHDRWHVICDRWQVTCDPWRVTYVPWQVTCDIWHLSLLLHWLY